MTKKHEPRRFCVFCRKRDDKKKFYRFVLRNFSVFLDEKQRMEGRGIYLHKSESCVRMSGQVGFWSKSFRKEVNSIDDVVLNLHKEILVSRVRL